MQAGFDHLARNILLQKLQKSQTVVVSDYRKLEIDDFVIHGIILGIGLVISFVTFVVEHHVCFKTIKVWTSHFYNATKGQGL